MSWEGWEAGGQARVLYHRVGGWHPRRRRRGGTGVGVYRGPTVGSAVCHGDVPSPPGRDLRPGTRHRRRRSRWARRPPRSPREAGGPFPGLIPHSRAPASPPWRFRDVRCVHRRSRRSRTWSGVCACRTPSPSVPSATGAASCCARTAVFFKVKLPARPSRLAGTIVVVTRRSLLSAIDRTREGCLPLSAGSRPRSHAPPPRCTKGESPVASRTSARAVARRRTRRFGDNLHNPPRPMGFPRDVAGGRSRAERRDAAGAYRLRARHAAVATQIRRAKPFERPNSPHALTAASLPPPGLQYV